MENMNVTDVLQSALTSIDHPLRKRYLFFRANHRHFFGKSSEEELAQRYLRHLQLKDEAPRLYEPDNLAYAMANYRIVDEYGALELARSQAVMVSSFHHGPYNLLGGFLSNEGVQFAVLANGARYFEQMKAYQTEKAEANELKHGPVVLTDADVINPRQDFTSVIKMMHKVRQGKSMLVYADGLEGQGGYYDYDRMEKVPFVGRSIYARRGTAILAHRLKLPIIFAMVEREAEGFVVRFFPVLKPADYANREEFVRAYCTLGYGYFADYFAADPAAWEILDRLQAWLPSAATSPVTPTLPTNWQLPDWCRFDQDRFGVFVEEGKTYLFDLDTFAIMAVTPTLAELLRRIQCVKGSVIAEVLPVSIREDLFRRGVLVPTFVHEQSLAA